MTVGFVGYHYPQPTYFEEFVARVQAVAEAFRSTPGCLSADCWTTPDREAVVSIVRWESEQAQAASMAAVQATAGLDLGYDDREVRPREVTQLVSP